MKQEVAILAASWPVHDEISSVLDPNRYSTHTLTDLTELETYVSRRTRSVVLLDLDQAGVTNHFLRELKRRHPVTVVGVSAEKVHPRLEESLRHHLFACLRRPLESDDLHLVLEGAFA